MTQDSERPEGDTPDGAGITAGPDSDWSLTRPEPAASDAQDTAIITPGPTSTPDAATTRLGAAPTTVDPAVPPPPYVAPSWSSPTTSGAIPPPPPPPQYAAPPGAPQYGAPQYASPQYGAPQYGAPQYGEPQYGGGLPGVAGWGAVPLAPKPGVVPLRPLGVGEILDGAITYIRRDPKTVLGISATIAVIVAVLQFAALAASSRSFASVANPSASPSDAFAGSLGSTSASVVQYTVTWLLGVVATGLLTIVMGQAVLGRRVTLGQAWERTSSRLLPLLGLTLLVALVVGGLSIVGIALAVGIGWALSNISLGLGIPVGVLLGIGVVLLAIWINIRLLLAPVALMLEKAGIVTSMRRSWDLVAGAWWRTFGIYLLGSIIASIVTSVIAIPFVLVGTVLSIASLSSGSSTLPASYLLGVSIASLVSSTIVIPFTSGIVALLYIDRRIRREALDIELVRAAGIRV